MVIVQRLEQGSRTEYLFKSLKLALNFIRESESKKTTDGMYEIYMPRCYK